MEYSSRRRIVRILALASLTLSVYGHPPPGWAATSSAVDRPWGDPVVYEVTEVDGKLLRLLGEDASNEVRVAAGESLAGGAELRTGWFSSADLAVPRAEARFHLNGRTRARLGSDRPGVLLVLEKGRLRALFDRLGGLLAGGDEPERRIETPSAVLAVRGTEYGVAVARDGTTTLVVFEGVVEVFSLVGPVGPIRVPAGQALHVRRGQPPGTPRPHALTPRGWDRGGTPPMGRPPAPGGVDAKGQQGPPPDSPGHHGPPPDSPGPQTPKGPPPESA